MTKPYPPHSQAGQHQAPAHPPKTLPVVLITPRPQAPVLNPLLLALTSPTQHTPTLKEQEPQEQESPYTLSILPALSGISIEKNPTLQVIFLDTQAHPDTQIELLPLSRQHLHVVALTSDFIHERVTWLNLGADDAMPYHIHPLELHARLRSVQRRYRHDLIYLGHLKLDPRRLTLWIGTQQIEMHEKEVALLRPLLDQPGRLHSSLELARTLDKGQEYIPAVEGRLKQVHQRVLQKTGQKLLIHVPGQHGLLHMVDLNLSKDSELL